MPPIKPQPLRIAFTIFPEAMSLDFIGPLDILSTLSRDDPSRPESIPHVECIILADSLEPVKMSNGMSVIPQLTFADGAKQSWDAVLVPGGIGARPWFESNKGCRDFLVTVVPKCRYVFTGQSWIPNRHDPDKALRGSVYRFLVTFSNRSAQGRKGHMQQTSFQICAGKLHLQIHICNTSSN